MNIESLKVVYFSPTGTTRRIVEKIARVLGRNRVETIDFTKPGGRNQKLETSENDLLVIGIPVYYGRVQPNAAEWLLNNIEAHNTPAVCIVVYGNRAYEDAMLELKDITARKGCIPVAFAAFIGEHSLSNSETPIAANRPDANDWIQAETFAEKVKNKLLSGSQVFYNDITVPGNYPYKDVSPLPADDLFAIDDNCSRCGECAKECPVAAIDAGSIVLIDADKCIGCCACIKRCPNHARTLKSAMWKKITLQLSQRCRDRKEPEFYL